MKDQYKVLLHGLANSLLPEFMDADKLDVNAISEPTLKALTQFLDHHMGDVDVGTRRLFKYAQVQEFFGGKPILIPQGDGTYKLDESELSRETPDQSLRTILGSFTVTRSEDGYDILDQYDFSQRTKAHYGEAIPEWAGDESPMSLMDIAYRWTQQDKWIDYETVRAIAGNRLPEKNINDKNRTPLDPKQSATMAVDWFIPEGQKVKSDKLKSSVMTAINQRKDI